MKVIGQRDEELSTTDVSIAVSEQSSASWLKFLSQRYKETLIE